MTDFLDRMLPAADQEQTDQFPRSPLGATDALDALPTTRDEREALRARGEPVASVDSPDANVGRGAHCAVCGQPVGSWSKVHFAKVGDARACSGSWSGGRK